MMSSVRNAHASFRVANPCASFSTSLPRAAFSAPRAQASFGAARTVPASFSTPAAAMEASVGTIVHGGAVDYEGSYEVAPGEEAQVLPVDGLRMRDDLTIDPIPSNYGRIAWNGSGIIVY